MSTIIRDASDDARHRLTASRVGGLPLVIFHLGGRNGAHGQADMPRADFLAAVETECGVRIVDADAVVIERAELPEVTLDLDEPGLARIGGRLYRLPGAVDARTLALNLLALAAHPPVPPVSDEDVETLAGLLWEYAQNPSGPGDTFAETNEGEHNRFRNRARRVLAGRGLKGERVTIARGESS